MRLFKYHLYILLVSPFFFLCNFSEAAVCLACLNDYNLNNTDVNNDAVPGQKYHCIYCNKEFTLDISRAESFISFPEPTTSTGHDPVFCTSAYQSTSAFDTSSSTSRRESDGEASWQGGTAPLPYSSLPYSDYTYSAYISTAVHSEHLSTLELPSSEYTRRSRVYVSNEELEQLQQDIDALCDQCSVINPQTFSIPTCSPRYSQQAGTVGTAVRPTTPDYTPTTKDASRLYLATMAVCRQTLQRIVSGRSQDAADEDISSVMDTYNRWDPNYYGLTAKAEAVDKEEAQCQAMYSKLIESYAFFVKTQTGVSAFRDDWRKAGLISGLKLKDTHPDFRLNFPNAVKLEGRTHTGLLPDILLEDTCRLLVDSRYSEYPKLFTNLQSLCSILNRQASKRSGVPEPATVKLETVNINANTIIEKITTPGKDYSQVGIGVGFLGEFVIIENVYSIYLYFSDALDSKNTAYVIDHILAPSRFEYKEDAVNYIMKLLQNIGLYSITMRIAALPPSE